MLKLLNIWYRIVSNFIWFTEKVFFFPRLSDFYRMYAEDVRTVIDVGANRGQSIEFFRGIYPGCQMYSFEPLDDPFEVLKKKFDGDGINLFKLGLSDSEGTKEFYKCVFDEVSTLQRPNQNSRYFVLKRRILFSKPDKMFENIEIITSTLDNMISQFNIDRIDILKIDVEGHELQVLNGAKKTLLNGKVKFIQLEIHEDEQYEVQQKDIDNFLAPYGYSISLKLKHGFGNFKDIVYERQDV